MFADLTPPQRCKIDLFGCSHTAQLTSRLLKNPSESFDIAQNERKSDVAEKSPFMLSFVEAFFAFFTPNSLIPPARNRQPAVEIVGSAD